MNDMWGALLFVVISIVLVKFVFPKIGIKG
jgi:uncharacterized membrane protein YhdT